ncbi:hypothetical protein QMK19_38920 [Streptomyces sp. H10-C2]|uniref:hypothetical protein n=1 Tax=unclassified Streptomyces TaxID=2593676 RepID=UPI0022AE5377|nr:MULTISPECIES: hypothetical protein [unclassified Streptomyces]MCZ4103545.1 hypothetical protein [Streptomyces sp. H39-C1]MDJ0347149.1 hypothetical protein [Streptomyces sp. PH10-H1]MDJ0375408.1 hypothetical protein [Streptomyces sp. H10-C2]
MALRSMPTAPGSRPDPRHETVHDPARGGWYPPADTARDTTPAAKDGGRRRG